jgi:lipopolysaccharide export system permease protein
VLLLIFVSHRFASYLGAAAAGELSPDLLLEVLAAKVIANLVLLLPLAYFLSVLLALGRLYADGEITAMVAAGVRPRRLMGAVVALSAALALAGLGLSLVVAPRATALAEGLERQARESSDVTGLAGGRFKVLQGGDRVFYAREISGDRARMTDVFAYLREPARPVLATAASAYRMTDPASGDRFMVLVDGQLYEGEPGEADLAVTRFYEYGIRIREGAVAPAGFRVEEASTAQLLGRGGAAAWAELHWRVAMPLALVLLGPLALLLARTGPRQGRYGRLLAGVLLYVTYTNVLGILRELVERGELAPAVGLWPVHGAMLALVLVLATTGGPRLRRHARRTP